jgi:KDO2-lipid IV(A) lauroyltransferase
MLADQDTLKVRGTFVEFFERPAFTALGPAFLARKTSAPILPVFLRRRSEDPTLHRLIVRQPIERNLALEEEEDIHRMLQLLTDEIEREIRRDPRAWVWMHDRWRQQADSDIEDWKIDYLRRRRTPGARNAES